VTRTSTSARISACGTEYRKSWTSKWISRISQWRRHSADRR
jgi:hypothetical protein